MICVLVGLGAARAEIGFPTFPGEWRDADRRGRGDDPDRQTITHLLHEYSRAPDSYILLQWPQ